MQDFKSTDQIKYLFPSTYDEFRVESKHTYSDGRKEGQVLVQTYGHVYQTKKVTKNALVILMDDKKTGIMIT